MISCLDTSRCNLDTISAVIYTPLLSNQIRLCFFFLFKHLTKGKIFPDTFILRKYVLGRISRRNTFVLQNVADMDHHEAISLLLHFLSHFAINCHWHAGKTKQGVIKIITQPDICIKGLKISG